MNYDNFFVAFRYLLIAAGAIMVGMGWSTSDSWAEFMRAWDAMGGALVLFIPAAWGLWVNWNAKRVPQQVVDARRLPTVDAATGTVTEARK